MAKNQRIQLKLPYDVSKKLLSIQEKLGGEVIEKITRTAAHRMSEDAKANFYKAPEPYWHYFNNSKSKIKLNPGTVGDNIYYLRRFEDEKTQNGILTRVNYKISIYNNEQNGYIGNVAFLLEFGFYNRPPQPYFRNAFKRANKELRRDVNKILKAIQTEWNK